MQPHGAAERRKLHRSRVYLYAGGLCNRLAPHLENFGAEFAMTQASCDRADDLSPLVHGTARENVVAKEKQLHERKRNILRSLRLNAAIMGLTRWLSLSNFRHR